MANLPALPFHGLSKEVFTATILACVKDNRLEDIRIMLGLSSTEQRSFMVEKCIEVNCPTPIEELYGARLNIQIRIVNMAKYYNWCFSHPALKDIVVGDLSSRVKEPLLSRRLKIYHCFMGPILILPEIVKLLLQGFSKEEEAFTWVIILTSCPSEEQYAHAEALSGKSRYDASVILGMLRGKTPEMRERGRQRMAHPSFDPNDETVLDKCLIYGKYCMEIFDHPRLNKDLARKVLFPPHLLEDKTLVRFLFDDEAAPSEPASKKLKEGI